MPSPYTDVDVLRVAPYGANSVTLTPSATPWAPSTWVQVEATTSTPWVVAGVNVVPADVASVDAEIDVGVAPSGSPSGSEVTIATFSTRTGSLGGFGTTLYGHDDHFSSILIDRVPAGSRVSVRIRKSGTSTSTWRAKVAYYRGPVTGSFNLTRTQSPSRIPSAAASVTVTTPASAWVNTTYGVLSAALPFACVILGANIQINQNGPRFEVDLATGVADAEFNFATLWENSPNSPQGLYWFPFTTPHGPFNAGTRLSFRARSHLASAVDVTCSVLVMPYPYL